MAIHSSRWRLVRLQRGTCWSAWLFTEFPLKTDWRLAVHSSHWRLIRLQRDTIISICMAIHSSHWRLVRLQRHMLICMAIHWVPIKDWSGCREIHIDLHGYPLSSHLRLVRLQIDTIILICTAIHSSRWSGSDWTIQESISYQRRFMRLLENKIVAWHVSQHCFLRKVRKLELVFLGWFTERNL